MSEPCSCDYTRDEVWIHKTIDRFEDLHKQHSAQLAVTKQLLEEKFSGDLKACFNKIRDLENSNTFRKGKAAGIGILFGVGSGVLVEIARFLLHK